MWIQESVEYIAYEQMFFDHKVSVNNHSDDKVLKNEQNVVIQVLFGDSSQ